MPDEIEPPLKTGAEAIWEKAQELERKIRAGEMSNTLAFDYLYGYTSGIVNGFKR